MASLGEMFGAGRVETFLGLPRWEGQKVAAVVLGADCATPYARAGAYCAGARRRSGRPRATMRRTSGM
jgi:agmatinase